MSETSKYSVSSAMMLGWRSMWRHPRLAFVFLVATLAQGVLQGLLVFALRQALLNLGGADGGSYQALASAAALILAIWVLRSVMTFGGEVAQWRLVWRVTIDFHTASHREAAWIFRAFF